MLYLFHGNDQKKIQAQSQSIIESLRAKREFAQVFYIHTDTFNKEEIEARQNTQGLFFDKHIFVYKNLINSVKETREYILDRLTDYIASSHLHLLVEGEVDEKYLSAIEKYKDITIKKFTQKTFLIQKEDISKKMFNSVGLLAELKAVPQKAAIKKIHVWKTLDEIKRAGTAPEEFFGILWWKYKTLMQARNTDQKGSGLTPYSFTQAKKIADTYIALQTHMSELLMIYHDGHNGESEMWESLEGWVLN